MSDSNKQSVWDIIDKIAEQDVSPIKNSVEEKKLKDQRLSAQIQSVLKK